MKIKVELIFPIIKRKKRQVYIEIPSSLVGAEIDDYLYKNTKQILTQLGEELLDSHKREITIKRL